MSYTVILYARISNEDTNLNDSKVESNSITNQKALLENYVKSKKEFANANILIMQDDGYSGANLNRPSMQKILKMVEEKEVDCIIVKDLSRFLRNDLETIYYLDEVFPRYGVRIISIGDKFDSNDNKGKTSNIDIIFRSVANRMYIEDLSKKIKQAKKQKVIKGEYVQAVPPFGYEKSKEIKNKLVIQEECAEIVRYIFSLALQDISTVKIAYRLNEENVPTCSQLRSKLNAKERNWNRSNKNNKWYKNKIRLILQDEVYIGNIIYGKTVKAEIGSTKILKNNLENITRYENAHEPIISKKDFQKVQSKIIARPNINQNQGQVYLFSKKLKCKNCQRQLQRRERLTVATSFKCPRKYDDKTTNCLSGEILENDIAKIVLDSIKNRIGENKLFIEDITPKLDELKSNIHKCKKDILNKEIALNKLKDKGVYLYDKYKDELITKEEFLVRKTELNSNKNNIEKEVNNLDLNLNSLENEYELLQGDNDTEENNTIDETLTRELIEKYIDCIYVNYDLSLEIVFNKTI